MVLRNSFYNMLGLGLPVLVALAAIPALIDTLGIERFGILTIVWAVVSYFGLFDFGLGRTVTHQVATNVASGDAVRLRAIVGTSSLLMAGLGIVGGLVLALATPWLIGQLAGGTDRSEVAWAFWWMAIAMPAIVLTSGYRGMLEGLGRFDLVNLIRVPMGVFTFAGPLIVVWMGYARLDIVAAVLCLGRILALGIHMMFALRILPVGTGWGGFERPLVRPMLTFGGWLSVSNIVSPLMSYVDRLVIGVLVSATAVAYYSTPQELILRVGFIPGAVAAALFPIFAMASYEQNADRDRAHVLRYSLLIVVLMAPVSALLLMFAHPLLALWITPEFADESAAILQIMAVAALASGLAQVPFTMLQGKGRADITGKLHLLECPLYLGLLCVLVILYGPPGAAWAWLIRIAADMTVLFYFNSAVMQSESKSTDLVGRNPTSSATGANEGRRL